MKKTSKTFPKTPKGERTVMFFLDGKRFIKMTSTDSKVRFYSWDGYSPMYDEFTEFVRTKLKANRRKDKPSQD